MSVFPELDAHRAEKLHAGLTHSTVRRSFHATDTKRLRDRREWLELTPAERRSLAALRAAATRRARLAEEVTA